MSNISKVALGTVQFGVDYGISNQSGKPNQSEIRDILNFALDHDIRTLDTASAYGDAETVLGTFGIKDFQVITKFLPGDDIDHIKNSFNTSLEKLNVESIYGYLAHRADSINSSTWEQLELLKSNGLVQKVGYSLQTVEECRAVLKKGFFPDLVQVPFNLFDLRFKELCLELKAQGVEVHTRSTFLQGLFFLTDSPLDSFPAVKTEVIELQKTHGTELAQHLLNYALQQDFIDKVVIGVQTKEQLKENVLNLASKAKINDLNLEISDHILNPALWKRN